ncbi:Nop52-domain-containing protein [Pisolithus marmoratus]|nr:Nop52-domain-containing protein [Pisolithus marmoratus]
MPPSPPSGTLPLGKYLASSEKKTRDKAVKNLAAFLSDDENDEIPDIEMAKLWKGIFYCFWMSDKPLVQQALADELAELLLTIKKISSSLRFLQGFWMTIVREWHGIDRLRMDKYYLLIRRFLNASFRLLIRAQWDNSALKDYNAILTDSGGPLCANDIRVPSSLSYHLADIYLEELEKALASFNSPSPTPLLALLHPFITLAAQTPASMTYKHLENELFSPLLTALRPLRTRHPQKRARLPGSHFSNILLTACKYDTSTEGAIDVAALRHEVLQTLFDAASAESTRDSNRRRIYALYKEVVEDDDASEG